MTTDKQRHALAKTRTGESHVGQVWCDYTTHLRECVAEAVYQVALCMEECGEGLTPEAVQARCLLYAIKPVPLPWDRQDMAQSLLEKLADHLYDDSPRADDPEWTYTDAQRDALAHALTPALDYLATLDLGHEPDDDRAIDVSLDFVREILTQMEAER
jgi:hypothetical protein